MTLSGIIRTAAIVLTIFAGWWLYSVGKGVAAAEWSAKYEMLRADYSRRVNEELVRQEEAALAAKRHEAILLSAMEAENRKLQDTIEDLLHEATDDPDAGRVCLSPGGRMRINRVR